MLKKTGNNLENEYIHVPLSIFPTPISLHLFTQMYSLQNPMGVLISTLAQKSDIMSKILFGFLKHDEFLKDLVSISEEYRRYSQSTCVETRNKVQHIQMCVLRNDYMVDIPSNTVKLVEYNTIAAGMGILCQKVKQVQEYVSHKYELTYNYKALDPSQFEGIEKEAIEFLNT